MKKSEIRKDYIQDKYVIIAPKRTKRPSDIERPERIQPSVEKECVFCPENIKKAGRLIFSSRANEKGEPWSVAVIKNKFPSVSINNPKAYGTQEVIIETPDHIKEVEELAIEHMIKIFDAYSQRTKEISKNKKINYILIFKNNGGRAGASLQHAHSQIFATQFLPPHLADKEQKVKEYTSRHGRCPYCDVIKKEEKGPRLVWSNEHIIVFCPWAPMHNYEVWIMPRRHVDNVTLLSLEEKKSFAIALKKMLGKITDLSLPYNYYFHQVVNDPDQHLYLKVTPRGSVWAGVEIGSGLIINPVSPEEAARYFKK